MSEIADRVEDKIKEEYGRHFAQFGLKPTMMDIYLTIFFAGEPVGLQEISEKTGYSVTTVANTLPIVEQICDVKSYKKPKSKKIFYECQHNALEIFKRKMKYQLDTMKDIVKLLSECEQELSGEKDAKAVRHQKSISKLLKDYETIASRLERFMEK